MGCLIATPSMSVFGKRGSTLVITCPSYFVGYALLTLGDSVWLIVMGRILTGIGLGVTLSVPMVYIVDIVDAQLVSVLGVVPNLFAQLGILSTYILGYFLDDWRTLAAASEYRSVR